MNGDMPHQPLAGLPIVVTGAAGGLGPAVVDALVEAGARCHLPVRKAPGASGAGRRWVGGVDLTDEAAVTSFYAALPSLWASVHVAGGFAAAPLADTTLASLRTQLDVNLTTAFLCCREAVRAIRRAPAAGRGGRIVNVSSRAAVVPAGGTVAYSVAKSAVSALTATVAAEVADDDILVNAVAPSTIDTPANRAAMPGADFGRWAKPAEIAAAIVWLVSPENRLTSGAVVPVFGRG
jgi:NAD(P)-dependent dehydrogenase (short-subunit alcohol dehydrogenase family)